MRRFRVASLSLLLTLGLFLSCTDGEGPVSFQAAGIVASIQIQPVIPTALLTSAAEAKPINLIRVTVTTSPGGQQVAQHDFNVEPTATEWALPIEIPISDDPSVRYVLTIELINVQGGQEEVQWSARTEPLRVTPGGTNSNVRRVEVTRGPVENLSVVSLTLTGPESVLQGDGFEIDAQVQVNDNSGAPTIFFTSLTPDIAGIDDNGDGVALSPGAARIQAVAGPITAVHEFEVIGVSHEIVIDPGEIVLNALGEVAEFTATVVDINGADRGESVTWSVDDDRVAVHLGDGRFEAVGGGETFVTATGVESPELSVSADLVVDLLPVALEVRPSELTLTALGQTAELEAVGIDAAGGEIFGLDADFTSNDETVAVVDASGRVTAVAPGTTTITASSTADEASAVSGQGTSALISADVAVTVRQDVAELVIDPEEATVDAVGETVQFTAEAFDAEGTPIPDPELSWRTDDTSVATVSQDGLATAVGRGQTEIFVEANGISVSAVLNVDLQITRIVITPAQVITTPGGTVQYDATVFNGDVVVDGVTLAWTSSNTSVGTIDAVSGKATGVAVGSTNITASFGGITSNVARLFVENRVATALAFVNEPDLVGSNVTISPPIRVKAVTATGAAVDNYSGEIEIRIYDEGEEFRANPVSGGAQAFIGVLGGTLTRQAQSGVATFDDLVFSTTGTFQLEALSMDDLDPAVTSPFDVVTASADLDLDKTVDPAVVEENGTVTFQVIITNDGPFPAELISVAETIPGNLGSVVVTPSKGTWTGSFWEIPTLAPGEVQTLTITGTAQGEPGSTINNSAYIYESDPFDPDGDNNSASASATVNGAPFVDDVATSVPPDEATVITIPVDEPDGDALSAGAIVSGPSNGSAGPVVLESNSEVQVTYTPNSGYVGSDQFTLTVTDEHGAVSNVGTVDITVASGPANVMYETGGNTELITGSYTRPGTGHVFNPDGVLATTPGLTVTSTGGIPTEQDGIAEMLADGSFSYRPEVGFTGTDGFEYTVDTGQTAMVTIEVTEMIWYVDNTNVEGSDTGASWDPFSALSMAQGTPPGAPPRVSSPGGPARVSAVDDIIFVHAGSGPYTGGFEIIPGQTLIGEGAGLIADGEDGAPDWGTLVPAGDFPLLTNASGNAVTMYDGTDVGGFIIDNPSGHGIHASSATDIRGFELQINGGDRGIHVLNGSGDAHFDNVIIDGATVGVETMGGDPDFILTGSIDNVSGDLVSTDGQTGGALRLLDGPFVSNEGGGIRVDNFGGDFQIDDALLQTSGTGVGLTNVTGTFWFNDIEINDVSDAAIGVTNLSGTGTINLVNQFVNNTDNAVYVSTVNPGGSLSIEGEVDIDDFGNGISINNVNGHVQILAPIYHEHDGLGLGVSVSGGSGTVDIQDANITTGLGDQEPGDGFDSGRSDLAVAMGVSATAIYVSGRSGTTTFNNTNVDVTDIQGIYLGSNGTVRFDGAGQHDLNVVGDRAFGASQTNLDAVFNSLNSDGSGIDGIYLYDVTGTFQTLAGDITDASQYGLRITNSDGVDIDLANDITTPIGSGRSVYAQNNDGETGVDVDFNGFINERGNGLFFNNNGSSTFTFNDALSINTSTDTGFDADNGGTIEILNGPNTIVATGQTGLSLVDSPIGPGGITLQSIDVDGAGGGDGVIIDNSTAGGGSFTVVGSGGVAGSGGTIENVHRGVFHSGPDPLTLNSVIIQNNDRNGIRGGGGGLITVQNTTVQLNGSGAGVADDGHGVFVTDGSLTILNSTVSSNAAGGGGIYNASGGDHTLTVSGVSTAVNGNGTDFPSDGHGVFASNPSAGGGSVVINVSASTINGNSASGVHGSATGTMSLRAAINAATITMNDNNGIRLGSMESGTVFADVQNSQIDSNGLWGVRIDQTGMGSSHFDIKNNPSIEVNGGGIYIEGAPGATGGLINGQIVNNEINGTVDDPNIFARLDGAVPGNILVDGNNLSALSPEVSSGGGITGFFAFYSGSTNDVNFIVTNNGATVPPGSPGDALHFGIGESGSLCTEVAGNSLDAQGGGNDIYGGGFGSSHDLFIQDLPAPTVLPGPIATFWGGTNTIGSGGISFTPDGDVGASAAACGGLDPFPIIP